MKGPSFNGECNSPKIKTVKSNGKVNITLNKNVTLNNPFDLKALYVANRYIFKCQIGKKSKMRREKVPGFLNELGPFLVVYLKTRQISAGKMFVASKIVKTIWNRQAVHTLDCFL